MKNIIKLLILIPLIACKEQDIKPASNLSPIIQNYVKEMTGDWFAKENIITDGDVGYVINVCDTDCRNGIDLGNYDTFKKITLSFKDDLLSIDYNNDCVPNDMCRIRIDANNAIYLENIINSAVKISIDEKHQRFTKNHPSYILSALFYRAGC